MSHHPLSQLPPTQCGVGGTSEAGRAHSPTPASDLPDAPVLVRHATRDLYCLYCATHMEFRGRLYPARFTRCRCTVAQRRGQFWVSRETLDLVRDLSEWHRTEWAIEERIHEAERARQRLNPHRSV